MEALQLKRCCICGDNKPFAEFNKRSAARDGRQQFCRPCQNHRVSEWSKQNRARINARQNAARKSSADRINEQRREKRAANAEEARAKGRAYYALNFAKVIAKERARRKRPEVMMRYRIGARLRTILRDSKSRQNTFDLLGYGPAEFREHIERQFLKGMGWHNSAEWEIDHIVPLSAFTITGPADPNLRAAWALPNLRPIWRTENRSKWARRTHLL